MLHVTDLIEILCAAHLSRHVDSPFAERGGLMLIGPPGGMKSSFLGELDNQYPDALTLTDLNAKSLVALRDRIAAGNINTLVFPEYSKIYERKDDTASNLEGALRALVQEGFTAASFEDSGMQRLKARALVIGAITPATQTARFEKWNATGFSRRFLWSLVRLKNPQILEEAILEWRRIKVRSIQLPQLPPMSTKIPNTTTRDERSVLRSLVKYQPGGSPTQQLQLMVKMFAVLKWWYHETGMDRSPMKVMEDFGETLGRSGGEIDLEPVPYHAKRRARKKEQKRQLSEAGKQLSKARKK